MKLKFYSFAAAMALLISAQFAAAQVIPFQGRLLQNGEPVNDSVNLLFSINQIGWSETHVNVPVSDGLYSVQLGSIDTLPSNLFYGFDSQSLAIQVNGTDLSPVEIYPSYSSNEFMHTVALDTVNKRALVSEVSGEGFEGYSYTGLAARAIVSGANNVGVYAGASGGINNTGLFAYSENGRSINNQTLFTNPNIYATSQLTSLYGESNVGGRALQGQYTAKGPGSGVGVAGYSGGEGMNWGVWGRARSFGDSTQYGGLFQAYGDGQGNHVGIYGEASSSGQGKNIAIYGTAVNSQTENWAGWFEGDVKVTGNLIVDGANSGDDPIKQSYALNQGVISKWMTFDAGNGLAAQINFAGGIDSLGNELSGGASLGTKGWETNSPRNGYLNINSVDGHVAKLEAFTDENFSYGKLDLMSSSGKSLEFSPEAFKMYGPDSSLNLWIDARNSNVGRISLFDSSSVQHVNFEARDYGGKMLLTKRNDDGSIRSAIQAGAYNDNSFFSMYGSNPAMDGYSYMTDLYVTGNDVEGNPYSNGYRRAGVDFYDNEGTRLAALGSKRDENQGDPDGKSGLLFLWGGESPNVELSGKVWENSELPILQLFGNQEDGNGWYHPHVRLEVQGDTTGTVNWGFMEILGDSSSSAITMDGSNGTINSIGDITSDGTVYAQAVVETSDERLKTNISSLDHSLDKLLALRGVSFNWKDNSKPQDQQIGLIAQEVETVYPQFVKTKPDGTKAVNYSQMVAILIESVKELNEKIETLEAQNAQLQISLLTQQELQEELSVLKAMILELADDSEQSPDQTQETADAK